MSLRRSVAFLFCGLVLGACGESSRAVQTARNSLYLNGDFEGDAPGASPASWTIQRFLNDNPTPLGGGGDLGLLAVPPRSEAELNLSANQGILNTIVVAGAAPESEPDPDLGVGATLRFPKFGLRSAVVNEGTDGDNNNGNAMRQSMVLSAADIDPDDSNIHIRFLVAPVLENPGHSDHEQPYFYVQLRNTTTNQTVYTNFNFAGQPGVPWLTAGGNEYTNWQLVDVAPGAAASIGDTVELAVFAVGCSLGGHWGRVYVDSFGVTIPSLYVSGSGPSSALENTDITYTFTYKNGGAATAMSSVINIETPPNTTFQSISIGGCTTPAVNGTGNINCPVGDVAAGASGSFTVTVHIDPGATGILALANYSSQATGISPLLGSKVETVVSGVPDTIAVFSGSPQSTIVNTAFAAPFVARVTDSNGDPVPNTLVTLTAPGAGASAALSAPSVTTDLSGYATFTATANTTLGSYQITADVAGIPNGPAQFSATNTVGPPASIAIVSGSPQTQTVNVAFAAPLVAVVRDASLNPVPGVTVSFAVPGAGASATLSGSTTTDGAGQVSISATANTVAGGPYNVTATVAGVGSVDFVLTHTPGAPASLSIVSGTPQSRTVALAFSAPLVAVVRDAFSNPVPGVPVAFVAPSSGASATLSGSTTTNASGEVSVTPTANTVAGGPYNVTAAAAGVSGSVSFSLTNTPGAAASIAVVSGTPQTATVSTAFASPLVVVVRDAFSNPVSGVSVIMTPPGAGASAALSGSTTTNASGQVSLTATANTVAGGPYSVTASAGVLGPVSFLLTNSAGVPATVSVTSGSAQSTTVATAFAANLVATVVDAFGNPVPGATVTFTAPSLGASASFVGLTTTNASGQVSVTATANTIAGGPYAVSATSGAATPANFLLTNTPDAPNSVSVQSGGSQTTTVGTAFADPLVVIVRDAYANPIPGVQVVFAPPSSGASAALSTLSSVTDGSGELSVGAIANTIAGAFPVSASVAGVLVPATFSLTNTAGAAVSLVVSGGGVQSTQIQTAFPSPLAVTARDAFGNPVQGALVTFTAPAFGASAMPSATGVSTNAAGVASITAIANSTVGAYSLFANLPTGQHAGFSLTNTSSAPLTLVVLSGTPQTTTVGTPFAVPLVVRVTSGSTPVPGAIVTFSAPLSGATALLGAFTVATNSSGDAQVMATAGTVAGTFSVSASVQGGAAPGTFALTNTAGAAASIAASPMSTPQATQAGAMFAVPLIATVQDTYGNPVSGVSVTFAPPGASPTAILSPGAVVATDASGNATVTALADGTLGGYTVDATAPGVAGTASFNLAHLATAPYSLSIVSGSPQSPTVANAFGAPLVVRVTDSSGSPVVGETVTFTVRSSGASAALVPASGVSDLNGEVQVTGTANTVAGSYGILAMLTAGASPVQFSITNLADVADSVAALGFATPQSTLVTTPYAIPLWVRVVDVHGNPVSGETVTYAAPGTEPTVTLSDATASTNAQGYAQVLAVASQTAGPLVVNASVVGIVNPAQFALQNLADDPWFVSVVSGSGQTTLATQPFPSPVVLRVTDVYGNPLTGVSVLLAVPGTGPSGTPSPTAPLTNAIGNAQFTLTANGVPGMFTLNASVAGGAAPISVPFTIQAIPTSTSLAVGPDTRTTDQPFTLTATVTGTVGTPTGQVTFVVDGVPVGTATLNGGMAEITVDPQSLAAFSSVLGDHTVVVMYPAQGSFAASDSGVSTFNIANDSGSLNGGVGCNSTSGSMMPLWLMVVALAGVLLRRTRPGAVALVLAAALVPAGARAQTGSPGASISTFRNAPAGSDWLSQDSLDLRGHARPAARAVLDWGHDPLVIYNLDDARRRVVVREQLWLNFGASLNLWDRVRVSANLPIAVHQFGRPTIFNGVRIDPAARNGVGDLSLSADVRLFGEYDSAAQLAAGLTVGMPTGSVANLLGEGRVTVAVPRVLIAGASGMFAYAAQLALAVRGARIADIAFNDEIRFGASAGVRFLSNRLLVGPELYGFADIGAPLAQPRNAGLELDLGAHYQISDEWRAGLGVGTGLVNSPGVPSVRTLISLQWSAPHTKAARPVAPARECKVEDMDSDGVLDANDVCPKVAMGQRPDPRKLGCPDLDSDGDGVFDSADSCVSVPAGARPNPKEAGCPMTEQDSDNDSVPDDRDACPAEPGAPSPDPKLNGCPGLVKVEKSRIFMLQPVQFATGKDIILERSFPTLSAVAGVLMALPEIQRAVVEGHTDTIGNAERNLDLSKRRAESVVKWLIERGVAAPRLQALGFGQTRPVAPNETAAGRAANRRVEFKLVDDAAAP
ncbi:MAG: Ig-like domain-containing protein [Myxococcaceae bacterium]